MTAEGLAEAAWEDLLYNHEIEVPVLVTGDHGKAVRHGEQIRSFLAGGSG